VLQALSLRYKIMQIIKNTTIPGSKEKPILLDIFYRQNSTPKPLVIFVHGFKGFKDWGHFNLVAKTFAENDLVFLKFNFSHNGTTPEHPEEFADLETFGNNNYCIELDNLGKVIDWALSHEALAKEIDPVKLYLVGHSRGGGISILKAGEDSRVKKLVTWASVSNFIDRNKQLTIDTWKQKGVVYTFNSRTKQQMPLYLQFYENLVANRERLNIIKAAKKLNIPFLIIHGTNDEAVSPKDADELRRASQHSELVIIPNANHTFGAKHPYEEITMPEDAALVIERTLSFLKDQS
jgi:pimeloyl-ACP methyl ester carboxylesterase